METIKQSLFLLKTLYRNERGAVKVKNAGNKKSQIYGKIAGIIVICVVFGIMFAAQAFVTGLFAAKSDPDRIAEYLSVFYFIAQAAILILGLFGILGTLYFSKDNMLLATLPVKKSAIFISKFLYCYFSELMISAAVVLVMITSFGVGCIVGGAKLTAWYFVIEVISIFLVPVIPLLIISLLSIPMMYLVSFIKKSRTASVVLNTLITVLFVGVCLIPAFMNIGMGEEGPDGTNQMLSMYGSMSSFTVFNAPLTRSMFLINPAANFFIYFGAMIGGFLLVILLSALTYPKIMASALDGGASNKKKKTKKAEFKTLSFRKTYLKKEIKMLFSTPTLVANMILPVIMMPILIILFVSTGMFSGLAEEGAVTTNFGVAGMILYLGCLLSVAANPIAMMGFSMEGKNIFFLKTLPLSAKEMVKMKLRIADAINLVLSFVIFIVFGAALPNHDFILSAIVAIVIFGFGVAFNRFGLYNDLKKPFLNWQNIQEINKNNKRSVKPMITCVICCISFVVFGIVFDSISSIAVWLRYLLFALVGILIDALVYILTAKKLYDNANALWEKIE